MNDTDYKGFAYDAAWLVALALNSTARGLGPNVNLDTVPFGAKNFTDLLKENLLATEFLGVTVSDTCTRNSHRAVWSLDLLP